MIGLSGPTIEKLCIMVRNYFPSTLILDVFKNITGDQDLGNFPNIRRSEERIQTTKKAGIKVSLKAANEMYTYYSAEQYLFLVFLKSLTAQGLQHAVVNKVALDDFISRVNTLLLEDSQIRIENYEVIQKWLPNKAKKEVFVNLDVPEYIQDYFTEALDCLANDLHRSSILFCTFALEASLRYKHTDLVAEKKKQNISFNNLIDWGIKNNFIEQNDFNRVNIDFLRRYRNDLAHCNSNKPDSRLKVSRSYAQKMANIVVRLVEYFLNNIFY